MHWTLDGYWSQVTLNLNNTSTLELKQIVAWYTSLMTVHLTLRPSCASLSGNEVLEVQRRLNLCVHELRIREETSRH